MISDLDFKIMYYFAISIKRHILNSFWAIEIVE